MRCQIMRAWILSLVILMFATIEGRAEEEAQTRNGQIAKARRLAMVQQNQVLLRNRKPAQPAPIKESVAAEESEQESEQEAEKIDEIMEKYSEDDERPAETEGPKKKEELTPKEEEEQKLREKIAILRYGPNEEERNRPKEQRHSQSLWY